MRVGRIYAGFLFLTILVGVAAIYIGSGLPDGFGRQLLIGLGVATGPAALVTTLFKIFLVDDVRREFVQPLVKTVEETLEATVKDREAKVEDREAKVKDRIYDVLDKYHEELTNTEELREGGLVRCYRNRDEALNDFFKRIKDARGRLVVVGSSLRGLLPDINSPFAQKIGDVHQQGDEVLFILMHPVVADLRAEQERRRHKAIGREIVRTLRLLDELKVPAKNVYLRRGTPTCFGIMTPDLMLLNPYPYLSPAMASPCFLISRSRERIASAASDAGGQVSYIFEVYRANHFDVEISTTDPVGNLLETANELERNLDDYLRVQRLIEELS